MSELYQCSAAQLAALVHRGQVSCRQVVEAHLARIDQVNDQVGAVAVVLRESALATADAMDRRQADGDLTALPLAGVPFTVKESIDCAGSATTYGVPRLARQLAHEDAPAVVRLKAAGAIPIARTNMSEMGMRLSTDNPLRGPTRNPWLPELTVGGSSGGDAAAVATGMTPIGLANDLGGSLRSPAYCAGIASLKPTTGRVAHASSLPPRDAGMATQAMLAPGPMARSIADLRLCLSVLAGRDRRDPRSVDAPLTGPAPDRRRAALFTRSPGDRIPASTVAAIERAGELLTAAGWQVERAEPPELERVGEIWGHLFAIDLQELLPAIRPLISIRLHHYLMRLCERLDPGAMSNPAVHAERSRLGRLWSAFLERYPVAIGPTWGQLPWPPDADLDAITGLELVASSARYLLPGSLLGLPALALPMGVVDGLPTGVQIQADLWREDLCLQAAGIVEAGVSMPTPVDPH